MQAHKLIALAYRQDPLKGVEAEDALFVATYEEGHNVSQDATLQKVSAPLKAQSIL